jgi:hypothetical protein
MCITKKIMRSLTIALTCSFAMFAICSTAFAEPYNLSSMTNTPLMETAIDQVANQNETSLPDSVMQAIFQHIEQQMGVDSNTLKVLRAERRVWSDGCLEVQRPGIVCLQVLTPGWIAEIEGQNQRWVYHTDETGTSVVDAGAWSESSGSSTSVIQ